jgi:hypothetical protein
VTLVISVHLYSILSWIRSEGNYVALEFSTAPVTEDELKTAFDSPTSSKNNPKLVEHFKTMPKGAAIKLPLNHGLKTDRSLKRQVNAAAKEADRELEWAKTSDSWIVRVVVINGTMTNSSDSSNGASSTEATTEEAATGRRRS